LERGEYPNHAKAMLPIQVVSIAFDVCLTVLSTKTMHVIERE